MQITPEQWSRVKDLYESALECEPSDRDEFLKRNSADESVLLEVRRLLEEHDNLGSFLATSPRSGISEDEREQCRFQTGEVLADRFRIVRFIAAGGMGEVYEAEDLALEERVAIKTIRPEVLKQRNALERFKREVHLARRVTHPNISRIFDLFWHKKTDVSGVDVVFVSMELLRGETLAERIHRAGRFTPGEALTVIAQVALGLEAAHRAGIVHRDLKPGNVILVPEGDQAHIRAVITDFGLALRTGLSGSQRLNVTETRGIVGTPAYMAPEQIEGKPVSKLTDIYALGLIIHEMVTGQHAFPANTPLASAAKRLANETVSAKRIVPDLSDAWEQTINRCLAREPNDRFASAEEVAKSLSDDTPTSTTPVVRGDISRLGSTLRQIMLPRRRLLKSTGLFLIVVIVVGGYWWWVHRSDGEPRSDVQATHKPLTFIGNAYSPALAPDGKLVAFVITPLKGEQRLVLQAISGGPTLELMHAPNILNPHWSPDGSQLIVRVVDEANPNKTGLFVISRLGGEPRPVGQPGGGYCWSPDGSRIVTLARRSGDESGGIRLVNMLTGEEKKSPGPSYRELDAVECSPQGNAFLLSLMVTSGRYELWVMRSDGSDLHKIVDQAEEIASPRWSPLGNAIYYFKDLGETEDLVKLSISGRTVKASVLATGLESNNFLSISADGTQLAYTRTKRYQNLWTAKLKDRTTLAEPIRQLTNGTLGYGDPSISPDGKWITFASRSSNANVYKMPIEGGEPTQLTFFQGADTESPAWSPDGRLIAFVSDEGGSHKIWVISADGGSPRRLEMTDATNTYYRMTWFPSSDIIYQQPGMHNLRRVNPYKMTDEPVLPKDSEGQLINRPRFSPDGKTFTIAWLRKEGSWLWAVTPEKHEERFLHSDKFCAIGWSADGKSLYLTKSQDEPDIYEMEINGSHEPQLMVTVPGIIGTGAVSPDGHNIIVNVLQERSDVWLMSNFDAQVVQ